MGVLEQDAKGNVRVVSLSFLGTSQHRETHSNIITSFHKAISEQSKTNSSVAAHLFDGLGALPEPACPASIPIMQKFTGCSVTNEIHYLLFEALLYLHDLIVKNQQLPELLNMQGFGEGADACVRFANIMYQLYPKIVVNLFLIDHIPVSGHANDVSSYTIPANVDCFESTLMMHEYQRELEPQHESTYVFSAPERTKVTINMYYGSHEAGIWLANPGRNHTPLLLFDDLYRFCCRTGSLPKQSTPPPYISKAGHLFKETPCSIGLSLAKRFELLCDMQRHSADYAKGTKTHQREILSQREDYVDSSDLFVNQEHRGLFKKFYPKAFKWLFEMNYDKKVTKDDVIAEITTLSAEPPCAYLLDLMAKKFGFDARNTALSFPQPSGVARDEQSAFGHPLVHNRLSYLQYSLRSIANYYRYHNEYKNETNEYLHHVLLASVKESRKLPDMEAVTYLEDKIERIKLFLDVKKERGYIGYHINRIAPNVEQFSKRVRDDLIEHSQYNEMLSEGQKEEIKTALTHIERIRKDDRTNCQQQYRAIRGEVIRLSARLTMPENDSQFVHHIPGSAFYESSENSAGELSLDALAKTLDLLAAAPFGAMNLVDKIIHDLERYKRATLFWSTLERVANVKSSMPLPYLMIKEKVTIALQNRLIQLIESARSNDVNGIIDELAKALRDLEHHYKKDVKCVRDELDALIEQSLDDLRFFLENKKDIIFQYFIEGERIAYRVNTHW